MIANSRRTPRIDAKTLLLTEDTDNGWPHVLAFAVRHKQIRVPIGPRCGRAIVHRIVVELHGEVVSDGEGPLLGL